VVAEAIRLKGVFFLAYRGRHPQSVEAVLVGVLFYARYQTFQQPPKSLVKCIRHIYLFNIYRVFDLDTELEIMILGTYTKQVLETRFLLTSRNLLLKNVVI